MNELVRCDYIVVRYVHDPVRDEPRNIGVILQCRERAFVGGLFAGNLRDVLPRAATPMSHAIVQASINAVKRGFATPEALCEGYLASLRRGVGCLRVTESRGSLAAIPSPSSRSFFCYLSVDGFPRKVYPCADVDSP